MALGHKTLSGNVKRSLNRLKELNAIAYTIPEKPRSQKQKYVITDIGETLLKGRELKCS
jgi:hypothetical protein